MFIRIKVTDKITGQSEIYRSLTNAARAIFMFRSQCARILNGLEISDEFHFEEVQEEPIIEDLGYKNMTENEINEWKSGILQVFVRPIHKAIILELMKIAFPKDPTISFTEAGAVYISAWKYGCWKTSKEAEKNVKIFAL